MHPPLFHDSPPYLIYTAVSEAGVTEAGLEPCVGSEGLGAVVRKNRGWGVSEVCRLKMQVHASAENLRQSLAVLRHLLEEADESGGIWMEWVMGDEGKRWFYCRMKEEMQYFIYCRRAGLNHFVQNSSLLQSLGARAAPLLPYVTAHMTPHMTSLLRLFPRRLSRRHSAGEADFMDISFSARADKKKRALVPHINMRSGWSYQLRAKRVPRRGRKCVRVPVGRVDIATGDIATGDIATGETLDGPPFCAPASLAPKRLYRAASAPVLVTTPRRPCPLPLPLQTQPLPLPLPRRAAPYSALVRRKEQDRTPLQRRYDPPIRINLPAYNAGTAARTVAVRTAVP
eukprot:CAMPEP_0173328300 /NCGR_PEP_ID=MMETSP1144-20121109/2087_1 /TAXON_ID=483371 /ORGANISM="non described non described, Strain CCMP2298" /LENGTH=341 /DNA_ID=CAMNT_0014272791 /DNA_START=163 /DNA_END=1187 /DNA_ORIENTATION=-